MRRIFESRRDVERRNLHIISSLFALLMLASGFSMLYVIEHNLPANVGLVTLACTVFSFGASVFAGLLSFRD